MTSCSGSRASSTHWWWQDRGNHVEWESSQEQREWMYHGHKRQVAMSRKLGGGWSKCRQNEQKKKICISGGGRRGMNSHVPCMNHSMARPNTREAKAKLE